MCEVLIHVKTARHLPVAWWRICT